MRPLIATQVAVAAAGTVMILVALVFQVSDEHASEVIVDIFEPKGAMSPSLDKLRPVRARLQALTGCECVDISKVSAALFSLPGARIAQ